MSGHTCQRVCRILAGLGAVGSSLFVTVPTDGCSGDIRIVLETPDPATPVIPLPPPEDEAPDDDWGFGDDVACLP